ncbi:MAG: signal peptidase I [Candidatus Vogelbacteria bacterium]|nr:signal peptidase I [Candidatus Vogelbacteria bacterium]
MSQLSKKLIRLGFVALITIILFTQVFSLVVVHGKSMEPTYRENDLVLVNRLSYFAGPPERGEIVAIKFAGRSLMLLKRIIGLPGETVIISDGQISINGTALAEPYLISPLPWNLPARVLAAEEYFVIGDNRRQAIEEHFFGRVKAEQIVGRALW